MLHFDLADLSHLLNYSINESVKDRQQTPEFNNLRKTPGALNLLNLLGLVGSNILSEN